MPVIATLDTKFDKSEGYYFDLSELAERFPHIYKTREVEFYLIEIRNKRNELIKRFKPYKKLTLNTGAPRSGEGLLLLLLDDMASMLNIGENYKVAIIITKCDGKPLLPLEIESIGYYYDWIQKNCRIHTTD